ANQLITDILRRIHEAIVENDVTYEEYQTAKQWFIDVGEAGEWPLFGDVYIEHVVEEQAFGTRAGSQGTILGPFHLPGAPLLDGPTGKMTAAAGWSPWRPAHIHLIVSAEGHAPLVTQLFIDSSDYLDSDVASAVKPELIVHPEPSGDGRYAITYDFALAPARTPALA